MSLVVNLKGKRVFIHIPKTGGKTISAKLAPLNDAFYCHERTPLQALCTLAVDPAQYRAAEAGHWRYIDLLQRLGKVWVDQQQFYAVVRNPWDKTVSAYHYDILTKPHMFVPTTGFDAWLCAMRHLWESNPVEHLMYGQHTFVTDASGHVPPNVKLIRYENFQVEVEALLKEWGSDKILGETRLHSAKNRKPYPEYYTPATRDYIGEAFKHDVKLFGYSY